MKDLANGKRLYEAPQLTAVTFKVEQGFATSGISSLFTHQQDEYAEAVTTFGRSGYGDAVENGNQQSWF